uniref:Putative ovule protein n=1 Tax=Solanum chacoense TaxID=4108 RepID=A0A0V0HC32_SOLCH
MFWQCMYCVSMISSATGTCGLPKYLAIRIFSQSKITELTLLALPLCVSVCCTLLCVMHFACMSVS